MGRGYPSRSTLPHPLEAEAYIAAELGRGGIDFRSKPNDFQLNCPFSHPKGEDRGHNLEVRKDGTRVHCWVCDWSGSWNKLAPELGLSPFGAITYEGTYTKAVAHSDVFGNLSKKFNEIVDSGTPGELPSGIAGKWDKDWRRISSKFLSGVPSYRWDQQGTQRILWPYFQLGRLVGYVGRRLDTKDYQKYYRAPWCKAAKTFFPFDLMLSLHPSPSYVVLVEGEVDALNLLSKGVPALATLGSTNWSDHKRDLLLHLSVSSIYIMMDPDFAGQKAKRKLKRELSSYFPTVKAINLEEGTDPGDLTLDEVQWLKQNVFQPQT